MRVTLRNDVLTAAMVLRLAAVAIVPIAGGCCGHLTPRWLRGPEVPIPAAPAEGEPMVLREVWHVDGFPTGLAVDTTTNEVYALNCWGSREGWGARVRRVSAEGEVLGTTRLASKRGGGNELCLVRVAGEDRPRLVSWFDPWGRGVCAFSADGTPLWRHEIGDGLDEIGAGDLDGDGTEEVILGCNARGGLQVFEASGAPRWKVSGKVQGPYIGNVWSVDVVQNGQNAEVVGPGGAGLARFNASGALTHHVKLDHQVRYVRSAISNGRPVVLTMSTRPITVRMLDLEGRTLSQAYDESTMRTYAVDFAATPDGSLAAVSLRDGRVIVFNLADGRKLASLSAGRPVVEWIRGGDKPMLVVGSGSGIACYDLDEVEVVAP
jgi:hypothetical protein